MATIRKTYMYYGLRIWKQHGSPPGEPRAKEQIYYTVEGLSHPNYFNTLDRARSYARSVAHQSGRYYISKKRSRGRPAKRPAKRR